MSAILPRLVRRLLALLLCAGGLAAADPTLTQGQSLQVPLIGGSVVLNGTGLDQVLAAPGQEGITIGNASGSASSTAAATSASPTAITFTAPARAEGAYDISLPWSGGSLVASLAYRATPSFTNTPFSISYLGGTSCTLTGANLDLITALSVSPGGATAAITSQSRTVLTFVAPSAHAAGVVDLVVAWAAGANLGTITRVGEITYYDSTPTVSSSGLRVSTQGGSVTIAGTNLNQVTAVRIDGAAATVTSQTATALTVIAPAHAAATTVDVAFDYGSSVTPLISSGLITYVVTPAVSSDTTVQLLATGGSLTLIGSNLNLVTGVSIAGGTASITSQAPTQLAITLGAHASGPAALVLAWSASGLSGNTSVSVSFRAVPVITADQKRTAKTDGSTTVTFTGSDLDLLTSLTVTGVSTASAVSVGSTTQAASIVAPARAAGTVDAIAAYAAGGASGQSTASNLLVYAVGPVVTSGLALSASTVGSTSLVITGTGLDTVTSVMVGGTAVTMNTGLSATRLPITVPAMTAGAKPVVLTWMAVGASQPANHAAGSFITYVVPVDPPTPPFVTDGGGSGGCGLGGVGAVLAAGSLLLVRRRRT